jgi:hypothetical protein
MLRAMRIGIEPRRPGVGVAAAVLALHLGLVLALLGARAWPDRQAAAPAPTIEVRLIQVAPLAEVARPAPQRELPARARLTAPGRREAQAITLPSPVTSQPAPPAATSEPALEATSSNPPALRLDLPRGASAPERWRQPALDDPRANTPRRTLEALIAGTMGGDDRLIEEPLGDGRIRYRRGSDCIVVHPARGALIDPFNQSASPTPRLVQSC